MALVIARTGWIVWRRWLVLILVALALPGPGGAPAQVGPQLYPNQRPQSSRSNPAPGPASDPWVQQERLIDQSLQRIPAAVATADGYPHVYAIAIAPLARQALFSREAKAALGALAARYGGTAAAGVLLSNLDADKTGAPLATRQNIADMLAGIGRRIAATPEAVLIVYLTSHGSPDASLESALPRSLPILAITADSMAAALDQARIRRRVIIVSACFSGSWIPRLANDDTILITAAAADRTSFGCEEDRALTYFGEAFLTGPFARGASLRESFEGARAAVTRREAEEKLENSLPQAHVGRNMVAFWAAGTKQLVAPAKLAARP
jgi:hypothetical protein